MSKNNVLNERRKALGLSIDELSNEAKLSKSTVEKVLFGIVKNPRIDTIRAIEEALDTKEESSKIKENSSTNRIDKPEKEYILSEDEKILVDYYRLLVPVNKMTVFNLLQSVFKETKDIPVNEVQVYLGLN